MIDQRRRRRLAEITGQLQAGYFRLAPRNDESTFTRADGKHLEILRWIEASNVQVLYLTGMSGSGKSSLLAAWVIPKLERQNRVIIRLRGYQDPVATLEENLRKPGVIWQRPPDNNEDIRSLLERACRYIRPRRLLIALDQFEEFVILPSSSHRQRFQEFLSLVSQQPASEIGLLLIFRSDYIGMIEALDVPPLLQDTNWKEVPPFTESAARDFMQGSGLKVKDDILRDVLREAAELEQTKGLIRPVTINLCGLVLGRFADGLPRGFRGGALIRGFLRESVFLPSVRNIAPRVIPQLITSSVTKCQRTIRELAQATSIDPAAVRGCLRVLGQTDRAIVHPLDASQETWEISHDFLVPLLDSIVAGWRVSFLRRVRFWSPWLATVFLLLTVVVMSNQKRDPVAELRILEWRVHPSPEGLNLEFDGAPPRQSLKALERTSVRLNVKLGDLSDSVSDWRVLKNLFSLDLHLSPVRDLSPLKDVTSLAELNLEATNVRDLSPLKNLTNLSKLLLADTPVEDLAPLKNLHNLSYLTLSNTAVTDLSPLAGLSNLTMLEASNRSNKREPSDDFLRPLRPFFLFRRTGPFVKDVSPLKNLKSVWKLDLSGTEVQDISTLEELANLSELDLSDTKVKDASPLRNLKNLAKLNLSGTEVRDVSPLRGLVNLSELDLRDTKVKDVSPLRNLKNLHLHWGRSNWKRPKYGFEAISRKRGGVFQPVADISQTN
jgi:Leucine-rich repeat (LRR) protein